MITRNNYLHFLLIAVLTLLFSYEYNTFIQSDNLYIQNLSEKYTQEVIAQILDVRHHWSWITYIVSFILLFFSTLVVALVILIITELYYVNDNVKEIKFKDTWRVVLIAQWSFVLSIFVRVIWFGFVHTQYTFKDLEAFYPLSLINLYATKSLEPWLKYPIQLINVFELLYWVLLVIGIKKLLKETWIKSFMIVFLSYGLSLIIWVVVIMFISINLSQV